MLKITLLLTLMIIGAAWCSCDSCGDECVRACGTRRFRAFCFNYLRKKRAEVWSWDAEESLPKIKPVFYIKYFPEGFSKMYDNLRIPEIQDQNMIDV